MPGSIAELAAGGRARLFALLKLGLVYAASTFVVFWLAGILDGGTLESFLESLPDSKTTPESATARIADPRLLEVEALHVELGLPVEVVGRLGARREVPLVGEVQSSGNPYPRQQERSQNPENPALSHP